MTFLKSATQKVRNGLTAFAFEGFFPSKDYSDSVWLRDCGKLQLPHSLPLSTCRIQGYVVPESQGINATTGKLGLELRIARQKVGDAALPTEGPFEISFRIPEDCLQEEFSMSVQLKGVKWTNTLAFLGRVMHNSFLLRPLADGLQQYRGQPLNKRLRLTKILLEDEVLLDFAHYFAPFNFNLTRRFSAPGLNIVGWFHAALGIGESARLSARSAKAAGLETALIDLKLNCKAPRTDNTFADALQDQNPYPYNLFHLDAPQSADIDHYHGRSFRAGKYNIAYLAWELPEFPDSWIPYLRYFDEVWVPSNFVQEAIVRKSPLPVITIPHAIEFSRPGKETGRKRFKLPQDQFLFLFIYDLNSYQARKNPEAVLKAYQQAVAAGMKNCGIVIKVHSVQGNEEDFKILQEAVKNIPGAQIINEALTREEVYQLEAACDCFVSLHRSEGFGLCVAECMYLGKPVISTDWSATSEFLNSENGCPVPYHLIELTENHGPYNKGQVWAEPNIEAAAEWMVKIRDDEQLAQRLGENAQHTIEENFSFERVGKLYSERLKALLMA